MSQSLLKFKINHPHVVAENFADEIIAINFDTGSYYSIGKSGSAVWTLVGAGATLPEIVAEISTRYIGEPSVMEQAVQQFINQLQEAHLIVAHANGTKAAGVDTRPPALALKEKVDFDPPLLCEYSDMQELLLLDPIHDVDDAGWPKRKAV